MKRETIINKLKELGCKVFRLNNEKQNCVFVYKSTFYKADFITVYGSDNISILTKEAQKPETIGDL